MTSNTEHFATLALRSKKIPLRVLRAMQFIARFNLKTHPNTLQICRSMGMEDLPPERLFEEWKKLLLQGNDLTAGLTFLKDCGWIKYFPEIEALIGCEQDPEWHPEGDVWVHTLHWTLSPRNALATIGRTW